MALTIRIIHGDGTELIKSVSSVMLMPDNEHVSKRVVYFEDTENKECVDVYNADVFVMNENGKTVADYHLVYPTK